MIKVISKLQSVSQLKSEYFALFPLPALQYLEPIVFSTGMTCRHLYLPVRAALKSRPLGRSNIACKAGYSLHAPEYPIPNLTLAPGFVQPEITATHSDAQRDTV
jgi:hypothetical protein